MLVGINGFNFMLMEDDTLQADFFIPDNIPKWLFSQQNVNMIIKITDFTNPSAVLKGTFPIAPFAVPGETIEDMEEISAEIFPEEGNGFTPTPGETDTVILVKCGTDICYP